MACADSELSPIDHRTLGIPPAWLLPPSPRRISTAAHKIWNLAALRETAEASFPFAMVKERSLSRGLEWSSSSREVPLFPSATALRTGPLPLVLYVHAQRDSLRIIRRRYRASQKGRENHRKAEQRRRMRRCSDDSVGDQGSQTLERADNLCTPTVTRKSALPFAQKTTSALRCSVCCLPAKYVLNAGDGPGGRYWRKSVPRTRRRGLGF